MIRFTELLVVTAIVSTSAAYAVRTLMPFRWRVEIARRIEGRVPDRIRVWLAGRAACGGCGGVAGRRR
jgi:hypothetical protein